MLYNLETKQYAIFVYRDVVDFRKQMNGLIEEVIDGMNLNPQDGSMYVFRNRNKDKIKVLVWDRNGFWLLYKRLEKGRFDFPMKDKGAISITMDQYKMLVSGMPIIQWGDPKKSVTKFS